MASNHEIVVVGPTGVIGREVLGALLQADYPAEHLTLLGSERTVGEELDYGAETLEVEEAGADAFRNKAAVILATPADASRSYAQQAQQAGAWVVDLSSAFKTDSTVPMVLTPVNGGALKSGFKGRIVTVPSPIPTALAFLLQPLFSLGLERVHVTALVGASALGQQGIKELEKQTVDLLSGREPESDKFPHRIGMNLIPQVGEFGAGHPGTSEEASWPAQLQRLFPDNKVNVSGLAIQSPTFFGHGLAILVEGGRLTEDAVRNALRGKDAVKLLDTPAERVYPMPMLVTADEAVHVGRISDIPGRPAAVQMFAAIDNAGRGAAISAVEVVTALLGRQ